MDGELNARLVTTATFLGKLWRLTVPYWWAQETGDVRVLGRALRVPERWIARALLAVVLFLNVIIVWILKLANDWNARFYNALEQKNVDAFWGELRYFVVIATLFILVAVYRLWFRQMLQIRWRRWLTDAYYREWLRDRTYYRMELTRNGSNQTITGRVGNKDASIQPKPEAGPVTAVRRWFRSRGRSGHRTRSDRRHG